MPKSCFVVCQLRNVQQLFLDRLIEVPVSFNIECIICFIHNQKILPQGNFHQVQMVIPSFHHVWTIDDYLKYDEYKNTSIGQNDYLEILYFKNSSKFNFVSTFRKYCPKDFFCIIIKWLFQSFIISLKCTITINI